MNQALDVALNEKEGKLKDTNGGNEPFVWWASAPSTILTSTIIEPELNETIDLLDRINSEELEPTVDSKESELELQRGHLKSMTRGKFGFIMTENGEEALFLCSSNPLSWSLQPGDKVEYSLKSTPQGLKASKVRKARSYGCVTAYENTDFGYVTTDTGNKAIFYTQSILPGQSINVGDKVEFELHSLGNGLVADQLSKVGCAEILPFLLKLHEVLQETPQEMCFRNLGIVKSYRQSTGFGFIVCQDGTELMVHKCGLSLGLAHLLQGDIVEFDISSTPRGLRATQVSRLQFPVTQNNNPNAKPSREMGNVKSYNIQKGYGFIVTADGGEALVYKANVLDKDALRVGEPVEYELQRTDKGKRAFNVRRVGVIRVPTVQ